MYALGLLVLLVGVMASIALHELGHLVPAKRFGVRVSRYMVGFGPTLWSRTRGETEYGIKAIPLGGYVRMVGMLPGPEVVGAEPKAGRTAELIQSAREASAEEILPGEEHRAFYRLTTPRKLVVMLGGPVMNLLIAVGLIGVVMVGIGMPAATTTVGVIGDCVRPLDEPADRPCTAADPVAPAVLAGLRPGDRLLTYGGQSIERWPDFTAAVRGTPGSGIPLVVERDGEQVTLSVTPVLAERPVYDELLRPVVGPDGEAVTEMVRHIGLSPRAGLERQAVAAVPGFVGMVLWETTKIIVSLPVQVYEVGKAIVGVQERDSTGVISLVGVGRVAGEITADDTSALGLGWQVSRMLLLLASLNVALFAFNMIPLLPLDGGHIAGALWEGAKRQVARVRNRPRPAPADMARMMPLAYGVFVVLIVVGLVLIVADVVAPIVI